MALAMVLSWSAVQAQKLYKWVDDSGNVSYHDSAPPEDSGWRIESVSDLSDESESLAPTALAKRDDALISHPLTLFLIPECDACDLVQSYLRHRKLPYTSKDVDDNAELQAELKNVAGRLHVPVLQIGERVIKGYSRDILEDALDEAGFPTAEELTDVGESEQALPRTATTSPESSSTGPEAEPGVESDDEEVEFEPEIEEVDEDTEAVFRELNEG